MKSSTTLFSFVILVAVVGSTSGFSLVNMLKMFGGLNGNDTALFLLSQLASMVEPDMLLGDPSPDVIEEKGKSLKETLAEDRDNIEQLVSDLARLKRNNADQSKYIDVIKEFLFKPLHY
ncbi:hypothetical protein AVEN_254381-1 [Araneus ventricosus]|uniref:Uncharacterized protein n=1 Tax=Araneus ventricosus TaxID=182803 RepID=A0A4Y2HA77_ARAVE|nr:hypothetical protein AVEN_254381-1 [Araneus ventricosus]